MGDKKRFGGASFGGFWGGGTEIFTKRYKLQIFKDTKTNKWTQICKKKRLPIPIHFLFFVFPTIDIFYYLIAFHINFLINIISGFFQFIASVFDATGISNIGIPSFNISYQLFSFLLYSLIFALLVFLYFFAFRGVGYWHGCEHKIIAAAEKDDLENAKNYSPVNDRCGGTFMVSIFVSMFFYWYLISSFFKLPIPVGIMSFGLLVIILESRFFHKYNHIGLWFGRLLQRKLTVKEPFDWQLKLGVEGMKKLVDCEYNHSGVILSTVRYEKNEQQ